MASAPETWRDGRDGPYIVSSLTPLGETPAATGPYLFQDLSAVPPTLASEWIKEFLNQSAQVRFWESRTAAMLSLRLRTTLTVLADGLAAVQSGLGGWITWGAGLPLDQPSR